MQFGKHPLDTMTTVTGFLLFCGFISLAHGTLSRHQYTHTKHLDTEVSNPTQKRQAMSYGGNKTLKFLPQLAQNPTTGSTDSLRLNLQGKQRQKRQAASMTTLHFLFLFPYAKSSLYSTPLLNGAVSLAIETIVSLKLLPTYQLEFDFKDSQCSVSVAMNEAINAYVTKKVDVIIGPICDYALAPVARQAEFWQTPVITPGGLANDFNDNTSYPLLVRSGMTFQSMSNMTVALMDMFNWKRVKVVYNPNGHSHVMDRFCHFGAASLMETMNLDPTKVTAHTRTSNILELLDRMHTEIGTQWPVIVLCMNADDVREVMIKAHELGYHNGQYVFLNIDLFSSQESIERSWYRQSDTEKRNAQAQKGFQALMTLTLRKPTSEEHQRFSKELKDRARDTFIDFNAGEEEVNFFVDAFHDSMLLYALALNETLAANLPASNAAAITRRMMNRTFEGIAGPVHIGTNGARNADFSLLDLNPNTNNFEVVGNYYGERRQYEPVEGKSIDWGGEQTSPPSDTIGPVGNDSKSQEEKEECKTGYYGDSCNQTCNANCAGRSHPCHPVNGSCDHGCVAGFQGDRCTEELKEENSGNSSPSAANIAVVVVIGILVAVAAFVAGVLVGRRRAASTSRSDQAEGVALNAVKS